MKSILAFALLPSLLTFGGARMLGSWELDAPLMFNGISHTVFEVKLLEQYDANGTMTAVGTFKERGWFKSSYTMNGHCYDYDGSRLACDFRPDSGMAMLIHADGRATMDIELSTGVEQIEMALTSSYRELHL